MDISAFRGQCRSLTLGPVHDSEGFDSWAFLDSADIVQDSAYQNYSRQRRV